MKPVSDYLCQVYGERREARICNCTSCSSGTHDLAMEIKRLNRIIEKKPLSLFGIMQGWIKGLVEYDWKELARSAASATQRH